MEEIHFSRLEDGKERDTQKWKVIPKINASVMLVRKTRTLFYSEFSTVLCEQSISSAFCLTETTLQTLTPSTVILIFVT